MAHVRLRDPVKREVTVDETVRPALTATECDACGELFVMRPWCGDRVDHPDEDEASLLSDPRFRRYQERNRQHHVQMGRVSGTFDRAVGGRGNMFGADACSFACADAILTRMWKKMAEYREFADAGAKLIRGHFDAMLGENLTTGGGDRGGVGEGSGGRAACPHVGRMMRPPRWILQFQRGERPICGVLVTPEPWTFRWFILAFHTRDTADRCLRALALEEAQRARAARSPGLFHPACTEVTDLRLTWRGDVVQDGFAEMVARAAVRVEREARREAAEARRRLAKPQKGVA